MADYADYYELESGLGHYQLEDGSGSLLLELQPVVQFTVAEPDFVWLGGDEY